MKTPLLSLLLALTLSASAATELFEDFNSLTTGMTYYHPISIHRSGLGQGAYVIILRVGNSALRSRYIGR